MDGFDFAVEAVAATGAHPTPKHAQRHPAASNRNCFIVRSEYASAHFIAAKKSKFVLEDVIFLTHSPATPITITPFLNRHAVNVAGTFVTGL
jgi:hypothetical protein